MCAAASLKRRGNWYSNLGTKCHYSETCREMMEYALRQREHKTWQRTVSWRGFFFSCILSIHARGRFAPHCAKGVWTLQQNIGRSYYAYVCKWQNSRYLWNTGHMITRLCCVGCICSRSGIDRKNFERGTLFVKILPDHSRVLGRELDTLPNPTWMFSSRFHLV